MMERIISGDTADLERAMILGLSKQQIPADAPLRTLALVGIRSKYRHQHLPARETVPAARYDASSRYVSGPARRCLVKLFGKDAPVTDGIAHASSRAIRASGLCLHPFDYAALESFIAQHAQERTVQERAWLAKIRPERTARVEPYADDAVTAELLPKIGKSRKLQYLRELRRANPESARQSIEMLWPSEPAAIRTELLQILSAGLSPGDRPFLESLANDRAQSVKDAAAYLLSRIRGTEAFEGRIRELGECIKIATTGLLRRTKVLKFTPAPTAAKNRDLDEEPRRLLDGLFIADVASALGETSETLLAAAEKSEQAGIIPLLLLQQAAIEGRLDLVEKHRQIMDGQGAAAVQSMIEHCSVQLSVEQQDKLLLFAITPKSPWLSANADVFKSAYAALGRPLSSGPAELLLAATVFPDGHPEPAITQHLQALAPLIPQSLSQVFIAKFEAQSRRAALYHQLLTLLPPHS